MTTTTERTGKLWKCLMLVGLGFCTWGLIKVIPAWQAAADLSPGSTAHETAIDQAAFGGLIFVGGLAILLVSRIGAWWFHG